jgi:death-on-curing family protein
MSKKFDAELASGPPGDVWWPIALDVRGIHMFMMALAGKPPLTCDEGKLSSALSRTLWEIHYQPDHRLTLFEMAARLGACIAIAHAFHDANKRTALFTLGIFLWRNGWTVQSDDLVAAFAIESIVIAEQRRSDAVLAFQIEMLARYLADAARPRD